MTPRERLLAVLHEKLPDRVPLHLPGFETGPKTDRDTIPDLRRERIARRVRCMTHFEIQTPSCINRYLVPPPQCMGREAEKMGDGRIRRKATIRTPGGSLTGVTVWDPVARTSWTERYPVRTREDL